MIFRLGTLRRCRHGNHSIPIPQMIVRGKEMTEAQFDILLAELMKKIGENGDYIGLARKLARSYPRIKDLELLRMGLDESFGALRIIMKYLMFDLEATRRERDRLITQIGDQE